VKLSNDRTQVPATPRRRPRFRLDKLEERIAPRGNKAGWGKNTKDCPTNSCESGSSY
jgi:hypothetical protein